MAKLGELGKIITGNTPKTSDARNYESNDICFVKPSDFTDNEITEIHQSEFHISEYAKNKARVLPADSILVTCIGIIGKVAINKISCAFNQQINAIVPDKKICDSKYVAYAIQNAQPKIQIIANAAVVPILNKTQFSNIEVQLPQLEEQRQIANRLGRVDKLIFLCKQQLTKLDELVKARFVEMFGDIILNSNRWPTYKFSEITSSRLGKMLDAKQQTGTHSYPYLANFNVQWFRFELETLNSMDFSESDRIEFELQDGDLLVCEGGEIGRCAVWHNNIQPCYFQKALHRVRCDKSFILPDFLAWWFKYNCDHGGFLAIEGAKATIAHLPGAKLKNLNVCVPPLPLQNQFAAFVEEVDKQKQNIQQSLDKLELLKKALMQEYFE